MSGVEVSRIVTVKDCYLERSEMELVVNVRDRHLGGVMGQNRTRLSWP